MARNRMRPLPRGRGPIASFDGERMPRRRPRRNYSPVRPLPGNMIPDAGGIPDFNPILPPSPRLPMVPDAGGVPDFPPVYPPINPVPYTPPGMPTMPEAPGMTDFFGPSEMAPGPRLPMPGFQGPFNPIGRPRPRPRFRRGMLPRLGGGFGGGGFGAY